MVISATSCSSGRRLLLLTGLSLAVHLCFCFFNCWCSFSLLLAGWPSTSIPLDPIFTWYCESTTREVGLDSCSPAVRFPSFSSCPLSGLEHTLWTVYLLFLCCLLFIQYLFFFLFSSNDERFVETPLIIVSPRLGSQSHCTTKIQLSLGNLLGCIPSSGASGGFVGWSDTYTIL